MLHFVRRLSNWLNCLHRKTDVSVSSPPTSTEEVRATKWPDPSFDVRRPVDESTTSSSSRRNLASARGCRERRSEVRSEVVDGCCRCCCRGFDCCFRSRCFGCCCRFVRMTIARCRESEIAAENKVKQEINQLIKHQTTFPFSFCPFISRTEVPNLLDPFRFP